LDGVVPGLKNVGDAVPDVGQSAGRDRHLQVGVQDLDDLTGGGAESVVQPGGEDGGAVADAGVGQGIEHFGFDLFVAGFAVAAGNDVLDRFDLEVLGDVFDGACAGR
jgi:hypothetical protein